MMNPLPLFVSNGIFIFLDICSCLVDECGKVTMLTDRQSKKIKKKKKLKLHQTDRDNNKYDLVLKLN